MGGTASYDNVTFRGNSAVSEGPAVLVSGGFTDSITDVEFDENIFQCTDDEFMEYTEVSEFSCLTRVSCMCRFSM